MSVMMRGVFLLLPVFLESAAAGWGHGWRDQFVRVSPTLKTQVAEKARQLRENGQSFPEHLRDAAKRVGQVADKVFLDNRAKLKRRDEERDTQAAHGPDRRRMPIDVQYGTGRTITVEGQVHSDMSLFDCPWVASLHPYLDLNQTFAVDGGLCLPYQEIPCAHAQAPRRPRPPPTGAIPTTHTTHRRPRRASLRGSGVRTRRFPFSIGTTPVDTTAANIVCPGPNWNPDTATCSTGPGTCTYPGDSATHGGATGVAENYGCAAANPGWPSSPAAELQTPICKTYVDSCTYSKPGTRSYQYAAGASMDGPSQGYDINWVLSKVAGIRNTNGAGAVMDADLTAAGIPTTGFQFPEVYTSLYGEPAGTVPPTSGSYPHAYVKVRAHEGVGGRGGGAAGGSAWRAGDATARRRGRGRASTAAPDAARLLAPARAHSRSLALDGGWQGYFDGNGVVDEARDGVCDVKDASTQWMDCGIPCPVGDEARMSTDDLGGFQAAVLTFMILCALIGAAAVFYVGRETERFFVGGRTLNVFVITATLASQSLDSNAALGNIDLGYKYHCEPRREPDSHPRREQHARPPLDASPHVRASATRLVRRVGRRSPADWPRPLARPQRHLLRQAAQRDEAAHAARPLRAPLRPGDGGALLLPRDPLLLLPARRQPGRRRPHHRLPLRF
jgi:hypothetical protein